MSKMETTTVAVGNIAARFLDAAEKYADHPAVGMAGDDAYLTYRQMAEHIRACATFIAPVTRGEAIGLLSENRPEWGKIYLAILACGGMVVPIDSLLKKDELAHVIAESRVSRLFVSSRYHPIADQAIGGLEHRPKLIRIETIPVEMAQGFEPEPDDNPDAPAALIFTSGTTGRSKRVILTHRNILSDVEGCVKRIPFGVGDRFLSVLPLHHTFEATAGFLAPLLNGSAIYYVKAINSREIIDGIKRHRITRFISVPLLYEKLYHGILNAVDKAPIPKRALIRLSMRSTKALYSITGINIGKRLFRSLRQKAGLDSIISMVSGGAPLPAEIARNFNLMGLTLAEGYGLTETSPALALNPIDRIKYGSVGPPLDNVEIKIDDPDETGAGEIIARGPMITPGYRDNPEETARLIRNGWLHTGDVGRFDQDGYLYISGRMKNLIVSAAGKNIYPEEIESQLLRSPLIIEAMVWGKKVDSGREEVAALIYPDFETLSARLGKKAEEITDNDVRTVLDPEVKLLSAEMADYKRVKHIDYIRQEMEKTSTKKIKRYLYQK